MHRFELLRVRKQGIFRDDLHALLNQLRVLLLQQRFDLFENRNRTGKHRQRVVFTKRAPEIRILLNAGDMAIAGKPLEQSTADVDAVLVESTGVPASA